MIVVAELVVWALYMPSYSLIPNARGFSGLHSMTDPVTLPAISTPCLHVELVQFLFALFVVGVVFDLCALAGNGSISSL
jgi:hypothetical protein